MPSPESRNFRYLNRGGSWPDFRSSGLHLAPDGSLRLESLAQLDDDLPRALAALPLPDGPGGLAMDCEGNLYWTDPAKDRVFCRSACDGAVSPVHCVGPSGTAPGRLQSPRGLAIPPLRNALFVADSGNHRIQIFDLASKQLLEVWPRLPADSAARPTLDAPWQCVADAAGNLYVLDHAKSCLQKFSPTGDADSAFSQAVVAAGVLVAPMSLAVASSAVHVRICVADPGAGAIFFFDGAGNVERDPAGHPVTIPVAPTDVPLALAAGWDKLFIGENSRRRILEYHREPGWKYVGEVRGYQGPSIALGLVSPNSLFVSPGAGLTPLRVTTDEGFVALGAVWSGRIDLGFPVRWHELLAEFSRTSEDAHLEVFAYASSSKEDAPVVQENPAERTYFSDPRWQRALRHNAPDVTAAYIGSSDPEKPKLPYLWVGAELRGNGLATPRLENLRVEFNQSGYLPLLPAIYAGDQICQEFLPRLLALFQGFFEGVESEIHGLPRLFDPAFAPQSFLSWLAGWLGVELDDSWPESKQREAIADAFAWFARRGTRKGLQHSIFFQTGVRAAVEEPILQSAWWSLPDSPESCCASCSAEHSEDPLSEDSELGWTTVLAPSQPDGAVIGTTAILDQSLLIEDQDFGAPLFSDVAYRFAVLVQRSALACPASLDHLRSVIEREMPAHTSYHLCVVDPLMRVGYQCRVGLDAIVAGPPPAMRLGESFTLGADAVLGGPAPALLGQGTRLGFSARIS
jgi:phage tail-like protein